MPDKTRKLETCTVPGGKSDWAAIDAMSDEEIEAAASSDPDAPLPQPGQRAHRLAIVKRIRFKLRLSQEEFAELYHIPFATLRAWERHEAEADAVAIAFLSATAADPVAVAKALAKSRNDAQAAE